MVQSNYVFEEARATYGKQVNHVLARHSSSYPSLSEPNSTGEGGGGVLGDSRKACALQASQPSLSRGGGGQARAANYNKEI